MDIGGKKQLKFSFGIHKKSTNFKIAAHWWGVDTQVDYAHPTLKSNSTFVISTLNNSSGFFLFLFQIFSEVNRMKHIAIE